MAELRYAKYGKDNVRLYKVQKNSETGVQDVFEYTVCSMLEGDIETSYTKADNSVVVPTDTQKQTTFIIAKQHPINPPELFASTLASHFIKQYSYIHVAHVDVVQHRWTRMNVGGKPHPHSFYRDGEEKRVASVTATEGKGIEIRSGIKELLVLKSTGSAFYGYDTKDEYTILPETDDRILSTEVECGWHWARFADLEGVKAEAQKGAFDKAWEGVRTVTMETFANENSPSVQATMYKMCAQILGNEPGVQKVDYTLPNKHYFQIDLSWHKGLRNTGKDAEVFEPQSSPNGLIHCEVGRKGA
ncbi:MAG: hypothetical protein M1828_004321 [Chrysothrix sp. TS-e1954]|nr:MAG: hypothetical protein M1828_004321 [Chrysothrix sp. TS-e1954]